MTAAQRADYVRAYRESGLNQAAFAKREGLCYSTFAQLKLLYWDGTGVWVRAKRLEKGRFSWPTPSEARAKLSLAPEAFALLVGGVDLKHGSLKPWYER